MSKLKLTVYYFNGISEILNLDSFDIVGGWLVFKQEGEEVYLSPQHVSTFIVGKSNSD